MKALRALVVDDEPLARDELAFLLSQCSGVAVVGFAERTEEALAKFKKLQPELVFVDLRMPGPDGLTLVDALKSNVPSPFVVVVTAHSEGAVRAYDVQADDYLLKPVRLQRLKKSLRRLELKHEGEPSPRRVAVRQGNDFFLVDLDKIVYCEVRDEHVWMVTETERYALERTLAELQSALPVSEFYRSHRGAIVRIDKIVAIEAMGNGVYTLVMDHPSSPCIPLARDRAKELRAKIPTLG